MVIADSAKTVDVIRGPIPVEVLPFGLAATQRHLSPLTLRDVPPSPDGGVIADYHGDVSHPAATAVLLSSTPGVVEHGLFPPEIVTDILIGTAEGVRLHRHR